MNKEALYKLMPVRKTKTGCWNWLNAVNAGGYGVVYGGLSHRFVYEVVYGEIPNGMCVRHSCDNPSCVNPDHLLIGTHTQNMRDMKERKRAKGGVLRGEKHSLTKLTLAQVQEIRESSGVSQKILAGKYGVSQATISNIKRAKTWSE